MNWFWSLSFVSQILLIYFLTINIATFFYFGLDKLKSQLGSRRISEARLWVLSALGGSLGAFLGMNFFHHKTKKAAFQAGFLLIFLTQVAIVFLILQ